MKLGKKESKKFVEKRRIGAISVNDVAWIDIFEINDEFCIWKWNFDENCNKSKMKFDILTNSYKFRVGSVYYDINEVVISRNPF